MIRWKWSDGEILFFENAEYRGKLCSIKLEKEKLGNIARTVCNLINFEIIIEEAENEQTN